MKTPFATIVGLTCTLGAVTSLAASAPKGWFPAGSHPKNYEMTLDRAVTHGGKASATLKCIAAQAAGFGTLMQTFDAESFRGKRVRLSGYARSKEVGDWAGLWMRVDGAKGERLSFDNMQDRALKGTRDWQKCEIVLDVPDAAEKMSLGLLLTGKGQVWMDDLKFEVVGMDVPTTGGGAKRRELQEPKNLDFEE